ncbi:unnamed protein product [Soboliphyme baturini]|uniref:TP6A_N domain-containing protein n=1 Tax=Soboliphyme baturini TaxID=241478 RepID=A0A183J426_9BILA|nr:unnamed protein product [Soboliphyme baturini]
MSSCVDRDRVLRKIESYILAFKCCLENVPGPTSFLLGSLYYKYRSRYGTQRKVDYYVRLTCELLNEYREALHILATSKGLIVGDLVIQTRDGELLDCRTVTAVPQFCGNVKVIQSSAKYVLVVEKDSVFEKLVADNFATVLGTGILITAKGYPDFSTRVLLRILQKHLHIPFFALMDADPNGMRP